MKVDEILKVSKPEDLFPGDSGEAKVKYRELARVWHPDHSNDPKATLAFQKITELYDLAIKQIAAGTFGGRSVLNTGGTRIEYLRSRPFELGQMYIGVDHVTYIVDKSFKKLFDNGQANASLFSYKDDKMKKEISRYLPRNVVSFKSDDKNLVLKMYKDPGSFSLRDVLNHFDGKLDPKHAAWIGSSLQNLACYFSWAGIAHHDISPDTYFISPALHEGALLGGWWYAQKLGKKVEFVPKRTHNFLPWDVRTKKVASHLTDLELIRATGRELLGDIHGRSFDKNVPKKMSKWLNTVASGTAVEEYKEWFKTLEDSFGKRKFTVLKLDQNDLYSKGA